MKCPACGLENPPETLRCDCGYAFVSETLQDTIEKLNSGSSTGTKKCPYCAETILADAKKCRYCGEFLNVPSRMPHAPARIPTALKTAVWLLLTSEILVPIALAFSPKSKAALNATAELGLPHDFLAGVVTLAFGFYTFFAVMFLRQQNWARIVFVVIYLVSLPFSAISILVNPDWATVLGTALSVAILVLVLTPSSNAWFKAASTQGSVPKKIGFSPWVLAAVPVVCEIVALILMSQSHQSSATSTGGISRAATPSEITKPRVDNEPQLELLRHAWHTESDYAILEGQVRNISSQPLQNVEALASFYDADGDFITSSDSLIEYNPLLPGQTSPFKVMKPWNPAIKKAGVEFKYLMGGSIPFRAVPPPPSVQHARSRIATDTSDSDRGADTNGTPKDGTATTASLLNPSSLNAKAPGNYRVLFITTKGNIVIEVLRNWAPLGADRFYNLVKNGFFTDVAFFRAISGFMVQFGISGNPKIAVAWEHANIKDDPVKGSNKRGMITYAMAGPNTRSTQFFINFGNNASLDSQGFAPFGEVVEGMDVVDKLYTGYGEMAEAGGRGPSVDKLSHGGKAYLDKSFPMIDIIKSARILSSDAASAK